MPDFWTLDAIKGLGRSEREYWVRFTRAVYERKEKRMSDLITKLAERAASLLSSRNRR